MNDEELSERVVNIYTGLYQVSLLCYSSTPKLLTRKNNIQTYTSCFCMLGAPLWWSIVCSSLFIGPDYRVHAPMAMTPQYGVQADFVSKALEQNLLSCYMAKMIRPRIRSTEHGLHSQYQTCIEHLPNSYGLCRANVNVNVYKCTCF